MALIEARGLRKAFMTTVTLDGINLRVEQGRILGLIGPNGAGKTTALAAILGLIPYEVNCAFWDASRGLSAISSCATSALSLMSPSCRAGCGCGRHWTMSRA
jgi:ABC-type branched-subunit amino acid transport system ATPase component